ncbi:MAG: hypothetical protein H6708_30795 [Kofleriaceae bacterium]|nr:hypothetical protein [Kofleriaceae bacterium]
MEDAERAHHLAVGVAQRPDRRPQVGVLLERGAVGGLAGERAAQHRAQRRGQRPGAERALGRGVHRQQVGVAVDDQHRARQVRGDDRCELQVSRHGAPPP